MVVGGRYQTTHVDLRGCSEDDEVVLVVAEGSSVLVKEEIEALLGRGLSSTLELLPLPPEVGVLAFSLPKSSAVPGVRGVLFVEPKDAKAPDPSPNAEDAPVVGVVVLLALKGAMLLKGFVLPPLALSGPNRLAEGKARE